MTPAQMADRYGSGVNHHRHHSGLQSSRVSGPAVQIPLVALNFNKVIRAPDADNLAVATLLHWSHEVV